MTAPAATPTEAREAVRAARKAVAVARARWGSRSLAYEAAVLEQARAESRAAWVR